MLFPDIAEEHAHALEASGDSMLPLYREGDIIVVSPRAQIRRGDRVVVKTREGRVMARALARRTAKTVNLASRQPPLVLALAAVTWLARIIWASQ